MSPAPSVSQRRNPLRLRSEEVASILVEQRTTVLRHAQIRTDGGTQMRAMLHEATAADYAEELRSGVILPPVVVFFDGQDYWLGDGFHRVRAHYLVSGEAAQIPCLVRAGTRRDAVLCAAGANAAHGLRRTNADKRRAVETLLQDAEWSQWSDREIARRCQVSNRFVSNIRAELAEPPKSQGQAIHTVNGSQYAPSSATATRADLRLTRAIDGGDSVQDKAVDTTMPGVDSPLASPVDSVNGSQYERTFVHPKSGQPTTMRLTRQRQSVPAALHPDAERIEHLLGLYRAVLSSLAEYGALTGQYTHTPAVRRALEPLIEQLRARKG